MGSALYTANSIFYFAGVGESSPYVHDRIDLTADEKIDKVAQIGSHAENYYYPVLVEANSNFCV